MIFDMKVILNMNNMYLVLISANAKFKRNNKHK